MHFSVDGSCRHVVATLFEVLDFVDDYKKSSCTSIPCVWVRRASQLQQLGQPVTAADLETSVTSDQRFTSFKLYKVFCLRLMYLPYTCKLLKRILCVFQSHTMI